MHDESIRAAVEELLKGEELSRSPQLSEFLRYIVERTLAGEADKIKAYAIAVDVFGRSPNFDPQTDPIVRVQGRRLRAQLDKFYKEGKNRSDVRIKIPLGRYVPEFESILPGGTTPSLEGAGAAELSNSNVRDVSQIELMSTQERRQLRFPVIILAVLVPLLLGTVIFAFQMQWSAPGEPVVAVISTQPRMPIINVGKFSNLTGEMALDEPVAGFNLQLITDLSRFNNLILHRHREELHDLNAIDEIIPGEVNVTGVVRRTEKGIEFNVLMLDVLNDGVQWNTSIVVAAEPEDYPLLIGNVSRSIAAALGSLRGPLHADGRAWVTRNIGDLKIPNLYSCQLAASVARDENNRELLDATAECFERVLSKSPDSAEALAGWAGVDARQALQDYLHGDTLSDRLFNATHAALHARDLAPEMSYVRSKLAYVYAAQSEIEVARAEYIAAVARNPADAGVRGEFALFLAYHGSWDVGNTQMEIALSDTTASPGWFYMLRAINALRERRYDYAIANALVVSRADPEMGMVLALSAAPLAARSDLVSRFKPMVLENPEFQSQGILPRLSRNIQDESVLRVIGYGLLLAGIPAEKISYPFVVSSVAGR